MLEKKERERQWGREELCVWERGSVRRTRECVGEKRRSACGGERDCVLERGSVLVRECVCDEGEGVCVGW